MRQREHLAGNAAVRLDGDFDATGLAIAMAAEPDVAENKSGKMLNRVQNGLNLQLNSWSPVRGLAAVLQLRKLLELRRISYFFYHPGRPRAVYGRGRRAAATAFRTPVRVAAGRHA